MTVSKPDRLFSLLLLLAALLHSRAAAGGFEAQSVMARSAGMGGVMATLTGNPASACVNPASLTYLHGTEFSIGTMVTLPNFRFTEEADPAASTKMQTQVLFPPNICLTHTFASGLGLGVSVTIPYSSKTDWGIDWAGRRITAGSEQRGIVVTPMLAFRATRSLSVGFGVNITSFRLTRSARILQAVPVDALVEGTERMQGDGAAAYGLQVGMLLQPGEVLTLGLVYKTRSTVTISGGTVEYEWPATVHAGSLPAAEKFKTSFTLPDKIQAGLGISPIEGVLLSGELEFTRWSSIDAQVIDVGDPVSRQIVEQEGWRDILAAHLGAEIMIGEVALHAGIVFDRSPVSDEQLRPSIPDADRTAYTAGIGYPIGEGLTMDVAIQSVRYDDRVITNSVRKEPSGLPFNGTYAMSATVVGLNVSYSWK